MTENDLRRQLNEAHENLNHQLTDLFAMQGRITVLEEALREIYEVYAGSEGLPQPISASEGYLLQLIKDMVAISRNALAGEKKDD